MGEVDVGCGRAQVAVAAQLLDGEHVDASRVFDQWAWTTGVQLLFSRPGKPTDNATTEAFNASVRRECLSEHYFSTLAEAAVALTAYRGEYYKIRPHSSLGQQTPVAFRTGVEMNVEGVEGAKRVA
jgi:hypothetical protein